MGAETVLVIEAILALLGLIEKHQDIKNIKEEEMDAVYADAKAKFKLRDPSKLPDKPAQDDGGD